MCKYLAASYKCHFDPNERVCNEQFRWLLTRNICQDPLDFFLCVVRQCGGSRQADDCSQFVSCFRSAYCHNILIPPVTLNCIVDDAEGLLLWSNLDTSEDAQTTYDESN